MLILMVIIPIVFGLLAWSLSYFRLKTGLIVSLLSCFVSMIFIGIAEYLGVLAYWSNGIDFFEKGSLGIIILLGFIVLLLFPLATLHDNQMLIFWFMLIALLIFYVFCAFIISVLVAGHKLNDIDYDSSIVETIYLEPLDRLKTSTGNIYISKNTDGTVPQIYYLTKKENQTFLMNKIDFDEGHLEIIENDSEEPRIEIILYEKEINNSSGEMIVRNSYKDYRIYIPVKGCAENYIEFDID